MSSCQFILDHVGLTRERVRMLTRGMRPDYSPLPYSDDMGEGLYRWLKKWGCATPKQVAGLTGMQALNLIEKWNASNPDRKIYRDEIPFAGEVFIYYCLEDNL